MTEKEMLPKDDYPQATKEAGLSDHSHDIDESIEVELEDDSDE